jgi:hypothetical protein
MHATATTQKMYDEPPKRPGLKPGQRHSGQFQKGADPRRANSIVIADGITLAAKARELGPAILEFWDSLWRDEKHPLPVRIRASELIVERGYGKAVSTLDVNVTHRRPLTSLTVEELEAIAHGEQPRLPVTINGEAIEAVFSDATTVDTTDDEICE